METRLPPEPEYSLSSTSTSPPSILPDPDSTITPYSAPFTEGEDILVHLEDGLIYFGVVVEVEQEQGQCLVRFGDCTERWSNFNELQHLGEISGDKCTPPPTKERPDPVGIGEEPSEIKILGMEIPKEGESGDKQLSCSYCDYLCSGSAILKSHIRVHTQGEDEDKKPYS